MGRHLGILLLVLSLILPLNQAFACPDGKEVVVEVTNPRTRTISLYKIGERFVIDEIAVRCYSEPRGDRELYLECQKRSGAPVGSATYDQKKYPESAALTAGFHIAQAFEGAPYRLAMLCEPPVNIKEKRQQDIERSKDRGRDKIYDILPGAEK